VIILRLIAIKLFWEKKTDFFTSKRSHSFGLAYGLKEAQKAARSEKNGSKFQAAIIL